MVIKTFNSKIFIRTCNGAPLYLGIYSPFFSALRPNFSINIFILSFTKVQVKSCDGFAKYSFVISILRHPLPPRPPLNLCIILPLNRARLLGISNWNYLRRVFSQPFRFFHLVPDFRASFVSPITFSISYRSPSAASPNNISIISVFLSFVAISLLLNVQLNKMSSHHNLEELNNPMDIAKNIIDASFPPFLSHIFQLQSGDLSTS